MFGTGILALTLALGCGSADRPSTSEPILEANPPIAQPAANGSEEETVEPDVYEEAAEGEMVDVYGLPPGK